MRISKVALETDCQCHPGRIDAAKVRDRVVTSLAFERDGSLILITAAVEFDPVREDPRFKSLLRRMGLAHLASPPV